MNERLEPLISAHARHDVYADTLNELREALDLASIGEPSIVVCLGPAGIGKSRLLRELRDTAGAAPNGQTAIAVEVPPPNGPLAAITGTVDEILRKLEEPLDKDLVDPEPTDEFRRLVRALGGTNGARLLSMTRLLELYGPPLLAADEAHNYALSPERARTVTVRTLKWICDQSHGVPLVLFATYAFIELFERLEPDLIRRFDLHEFRRYRIDDPKDEIAYGAALQLLRKRILGMGLMDGYDPWTDREWIQQKTYGSVALLDKWLVKATARAVRAGRDLARDDLIKAYGSVISDPDAYEKALTIGEAKFAVRRQAWGRDSKAAKPGSGSKTQAAQTDAERATTPRPPRPFQGSLTPVPVGAGRGKKAASA